MSALVELSESFRFVVCDLPTCRAIFHLCSKCDRGQRYCGEACSYAARRVYQRRSNAAHQRSAEGRDDHRDRQRAYRARQQRVTEQGGENLPLRAKSLSPSGSAFTSFAADCGREEKCDERDDLDGYRAWERGDARACDKRGSDAAQGTPSERTEPSSGPAMASRSGGTVAGQPGPLCAVCQRRGRYSRHTALWGLLRGRRWSSLLARVRRPPPRGQPSG